MRVWNQSNVSLGAPGLSSSCFLWVSCSSSSILVSSTRRPVPVGVAVESMSLGCRGSSSVFSSAVAGVPLSLSIGTSAAPLVLNASNHSCVNWVSIDLTFLLVPIASSVGRGM